MATDFLLPTDGDADGGCRTAPRSTQQLHDIVVTFDSDMMTTGGTTGANSVINPNNWALMKNGVLVTGGIGQVYYGMNEAATRLGMPASNKWEAVLVLNGSGNSRDQRRRICRTAITRSWPPRRCATRTATPWDGPAIPPTASRSPATSTCRCPPAAKPASTPTPPAIRTRPRATRFSGSRSRPRPVRAGHADRLVYAQHRQLYQRDDLHFDSSNLTAVATAIQAQLCWPATTGLSSRSTQSTAPYILSVRFGGDDAGIAQPLISIITGDPGRDGHRRGSQKGSAVPPPQATASDANGDYVVVWTSDTVGAAGVYAKVYPANWTNTDTTNGHQANPPANPTEILVTSNPTATYASVACDAAGDFVVTWSEQDARRLERLGRRVRGQRQSVCWPAFMVNTHDRGRAGILGRGDGRRRRLRDHLAEPEPGRQRLGRLCPALRFGGESVGRPE